MVGGPLLLPIEIETGAFIGANSILLPGTKIGKNTVVGAGSVVKGNIPDNVVVAGNPARVIKTTTEYYEKMKNINDGNIRFL